jgi:hypothetical protein
LAVRAVSRASRKPFASTAVAIITGFLSFAELSLPLAGPTLFCLEGLLLNMEFAFFLVLCCFLLPALGQEGSDTPAFTWTSPVKGDAYVTGDTIVGTW